MVDKLRALVTEWVSIPEADVEREYRRRNDTVKLALVPFPLESFRSSVTVGDAEIAAHFEANPEAFRVPEKRQIRYVLVDVEALRAKTVVAPADVERAYNDRFDEFSTPEQIRASHILLTLEGKEEGAVSAQAADLVAKARAGADFAALAKEFSEDEGTATAGGDLDYFTRGRMVPEFDQAAFALEVGEVSDPVKTAYGFHVIKVTDKKPVITQTLEEVRPQLSEQIALERAQEQAIDLAENLERLIGSAADLDRVAAAQGLMVQETGFFARDEPIFTLGAAPELADRVFSLEAGQVTGAMPAARGFVVGALVGVQPSYVPKLEEVTERVREDLTRTRAREMAQQRATELAAALKGVKSFEEAAKKIGYEVATTELITRESPVPGLGNAPAILDAAFGMPVGAVSDAVFTDTGAAVFTVLEKQETSAEDLQENRDRFREELLADRRNRFFGAYMVKVKQNMQIQINREAVQRMVG
jgi:peptidyl-prolyl cis-trans isomerase D